jgi:hypothetical protein
MWAIPAPIAQSAASAHAILGRVGQTAIAPSAANTQITPVMAIDVMWQSNRLTESWKLDLVWLMANLLSIRERSMRYVF